MAESEREILARLPGKDCGQCGFQTCAGLAELVALHPEEIKRCVHLGHPSGATIPILPANGDITWKDMLGREYDFVLEPFPEDPGPREVIAPLNPLNVERLAVKKGDVLYGRPVMTGYPVTHVGVVVEDPDYLSGVIVWCIVGPMAARERGREIGHYHIIAYEGLVRHTREELQIGRRYFFLPRMCMLQSRHSGLVNALAKRKDGLRARVEGIWIA
ncbi:MAG: hypothetical protein A3F73_11550 [Gallionellales bacterium RIFCSPLOWO2_12_FULL_59_22]|nr:MAG: hypothetical protein A3H99_07490 [Gallionellales bacterium RIFCSPLOWO2_02_FULL_59_110]OGT14814.1 MAG: hypothetical protein A3F73_11550 [Gallionellales bacterium RIFCSPLOWO2_12_FULL_59_22]